MVTPPQQHFVNDAFKVLADYGTPASRLHRCANFHVAIVVPSDHLHD